ncbi:coiled-coil domain-containing protein 141-like [Cyprinodon tularosa]|uniref:coiled-coil domain-containing protein 141-like n=1 Tax=Cyprinodon tularosa TaxID=77115 RepID=UPI0018E28EE1|nr:coiled-coil domain-containing protein 141-like [Cyprinodon tularosa]
MGTGRKEETEERCGNQSREESSSSSAAELRGSFTALSSIAIQAGRSQIVASVLKSGSLIHLQLVQFQPGLCQIGSNQEENHILIQELLQLLEKLQKHEPEVFAVVEKKQKERLRMRRDAGRKQKQDEELKEAMKASLSEGWSLLLRLLERRLEVLQMASDVFSRVTEFAAGIDRLEDLQSKADEDKLTEVQLSFDFIRKDLLGKSLQVLTSSSLLLQKLRQLQRTEALQRTGRVLQDGEAELDQVKLHDDQLQIRNLSDHRA